MGKDKESKEESGNAFAQQKGKFSCHCCGKPDDHKAFTCTLKEKIPREQWHKETSKEWYKNPPTTSFVQEATVTEVISPEAKELEDL